MEPTQRVSDILAELKQKGLVTGDNKLMTEQSKQEAKVEAEQIAKAVSSGNSEEIFSTIRQQQEMFRNSINMRLVEMQNQIDNLKKQVEELKSKQVVQEVSQRPIPREVQQSPPQGYRPSTDIHELEQARSESTGSKSTADPTYSQRRGNFKPGDIDIRDVFNFGKKK